jgi:hypothetical protein
MFVKCFWWGFIRVSASYALQLALCISMARMSGAPVCGLFRFMTSKYNQEECHTMASPFTLKKGSS